MQCDQAYLLLSKSPDGASGHHTIPPQLVLTAWQAFRATQEAAIQAPLPDITQDVARCLAAIGVPYALNFISEDGLLALSLAVPDR